MVIMFKRNTKHDCLCVHQVKPVKTNNIHVCRMQFIRTVQYKWHTWNPLVGEMSLLRTPNDAIDHKQCMLASVPVCPVFCIQCYRKPSDPCDERQPCLPAASWRRSSFEEHSAWWHVAVVHLQSVRLHSTTMKGKCTHIKGEEWWETRVHVEKWIFWKMNNAKHCSVKVFKTPVWLRRAQT